MTLRQQLATILYKAISHASVCRIHHSAVCQSFKQLFPCWTHCYEYSEKGARQDRSTDKDGVLPRCVRGDSIHRRSHK